MKLRHPSELKLSQRLRLRLFGRVYVGHRTRSGWRGSLPFYAFKCPEHGVVVDYPQGFDMRLVCPYCSESSQAPSRAPDLEVRTIEAAPVQ